MVVTSSGGAAHRINYQGEAARAWHQPPPGGKGLTLSAGATATDERMAKILEAATRMDRPPPPPVPAAAQPPPGPGADWLEQWRSTRGESFEA
jgi:hypothetical protein